MTSKVIIKSNKYGINLILDDQVPFPELLQIVADKFKESGEFFKDAKMTVSFENRELTAKEQQQLADTIMENSTIHIVSILDTNKDLEEMMRTIVESSADLQKSTQSAAYMQSQGYAQMELPPAADFYKGNLRSGQTLECASSVTLIGDVNPGATIRSDGNIVVLGSLKGTACAGACGGDNCFIIALDMRPIQLQIGDLIAKSPDKEKENGRTRKRGRADNGQYFAQVALVRDGYICIEPMTKGCLDHL